MEVTGIIIKKFDRLSGVSKAGNNWSKQEYVLETQEAYPKKIFFSFFGDRADQFPLEVGDNVRLSFDIDSHEYNGRWFTSINGWKAEKVETNAQQPVAGMPAAQTVQAPPMPDFSGSDDSTDDLPF